jgi:hypothetical protein
MSERWTYVFELSAPYDDLDPHLAVVEFQGSEEATFDHANRVATRYFNEETDLNPLKDVFGTDGVVTSVFKADVSGLWVGRADHIING